MGEPMFTMNHRSFTLVALLSTLLLAPVLRAGTPLICHPYNIGDARSLPSGPDWHGVSRHYDRANLTRDTLALLTPDTPVLVRMETLRRAAIYATAGMRQRDRDAYSADDRATATSLFERLRERTKDASGSARALALFDAGFFVETLRHARMDLGVDGYALVAKAAELRPGDAEIDFALALATSWPGRRDNHAAHLRSARNGAKPGTLLVVNLRSHFGG